MDIYWSQHNTPIPQAAYLKPDLAIRSFPKFDIQDFGLRPTSCPALTDFYKNTYCIKSPIDYLLHVNENGDLETKYYDQHMFDSLVFVRDKTHRLYSIGFNDIFIAEEPCIMQQLSAHTVMNSFTKSTVVCPAQYDIGKWYRPLDCAFFVRNGENTISIERDQPLYFLKFLTQEKINMKRFHMTQEISDMLMEFFKTKFLIMEKERRENNSGNRVLNSTKKLDYYYDMFFNSSYKSKLLPMIKENTLE